MVLFCLILGGVSFAISAVLCAVVKWASNRLGLIDAAGSEAHKPASGNMVPNTGGMGVFWAVAGPMMAIMVAVWMLPEAWWAGQLPVVSPHVDGLRQTSVIGGGVLLALAVLHVLGLYDDRRALGPLLKLGVQVAVAIGLVLWCDMRVLDFLRDNGWAGVLLSVGISVLWVVVVTNAMNFLDNMDGLAAGVGLIAAGVYLAATLIGGQWFVAALSAMLAGALAGFLLFNIPPAKLYLGDGGSLVLGLMLAVISIRTTYFDTSAVTGLVTGQGEACGSALGGAAALGAGGEVSSVQGAGRWYGLLMPVMVLAVPLYDFFSVTLLRVLARKNPLAGDHNHFSHRLVRMGLSRRAALVVICLAALATGIGGVMLGTLEQWQAMLVGAQAAAVIAMIAVLERWGSRG